MPSDEEASVNRWGGYYIGRFEAGDKEVTDAKMMRADYRDNKLNEYIEESGIDIYNLSDEQLQELMEKRNSANKKYKFRCISPN